jgi:uncharacterized protein
MSKKFQVTCDLFMIPYKEDSSLLYAPRVGYVCAANAELVNLLAELDHSKNNYSDKQLQVLNELESGGVLNGSNEAEINSFDAEKFAPTGVTLFPTNQCNLRCIYCYASAGERSPKNMEFHFAETAIHTIIQNAKDKGTNRISVGFHGGGEPLFPWNFVKKVSEFAEMEAREHGLNLALYSATNGLLSEKQLDWITEHFSDLNISFDGLPRVQDYHRPLPNGQGSFEFIDRTFKYLDRKEFNYGIRSTFSEYNIDLMEESYDFIVQNYRPRTIHFEPVFQCGRCKTKAEFEVELDKFARNFQIIDQKNQKQSFRFTYSGCRLETLTNSFCGVSRDGFSVTTDGHITACFETTSSEDPKSEFFFYGHMDEDGTIILDEKKRKYLHDLRVENLEYCKDCYAKWHCAGDCVAKLGHDELDGPRGHDRCLLNRKMVRDKLIGALNMK